MREFHKNGNAAKIANFCVLAMAGFIFVPSWLSGNYDRNSFGQNNLRPLISSAFSKTKQTLEMPSYLGAGGIKLPVLMYHYIRDVQDSKADPLGYNLSVNPKEFSRQMEYLVKYGYTTITPEDLYKALVSSKVLPVRSVLLTFDDGYRDFYTEAFPILKKFSLEATLFVITAFVGDEQGKYVTWDQIKEMEQSGLVTIGSHTEHHVNLVTNAEARAEILDSKKILEEKLGHSVTDFCYPYGRYNDRVVSLVKEAGYNLAFTTKQGISMSFDNRLVLPRERISGLTDPWDFGWKLEMLAASKYFKRAN